MTADGILEVGETWTYTISYTVTSGDIASGSNLVNTASVVTDQVPGPTQDDETTPITIPLIPGLTLTKSADPNEYIKAGDIILYSYLLTNSGQTTLYAPFTVIDDKASVTCPAEPASLLPGESITCSAIYTITQAGPGCRQRDQYCHGQCQGSGWG